MKGYDFPTVDDGITGMAFIENPVRKAGAVGGWCEWRFVVGRLLRSDKFRGQRGFV
jgi:hypothetical protein